MCRLFHKPSDSCATANCDEIENVNSTPTTARCSPDDTSSEMVQETATSRVHTLNKSDDTERCSNDMGSDVKPYDPVINNTSVSHAGTSHTKDCVFGKTPVEVIHIFRLFVSSGNLISLKYSILYHNFVHRVPS